MVNFEFYPLNCELLALPEQTCFGTMTVTGFLVKFEAPVKVALACNIIVSP